MIRKFIYGTPFDTEAVTTEIPCSDGTPAYGTVCTSGSPDAGDGFTFTYTMDKDDIVYGLGEANRGINKRGWRYTSNCTDDPNHTEDKHSLYGAHNFVIISGKETFGLFLPARIRCASSVKMPIWPCMSSKEIPLTTL